MSKALDLIKNPNRLRQLLAAKYFYSIEDHQLHIIDILLYSKHCKFHILYAETLLDYDLTDYIQEHYPVIESKHRIHKLTEYYHSYQQFFGQPLLNDWRNVHILKIHHEKKAEVFYINNYHTKNDGFISNEQNAYLESNSSSNDLTNNKVIFNSKLKAKINSIKELCTSRSNKNNLNGNAMNNNVLISTISFANNDKNSLNSSYDLYSKRSPVNSLGNIVFSFRKEPPVHYKSNQNPLGKKKIIKAVIYKEKDKETSKEKHSLHSFKPPYFHKFRSNLIEFTKNKPNLIASIQCSTKKNSLVSSDRNFNQNLSSIMKKTNSNKTFDSNSAQIAKIAHCRPLIKESNGHNLQPTRNAKKSIYFCHMNNVPLLKSNSTRVNLSNNKTKNQSLHKFSLSSCASAVFLKPKKMIALIKKPNLLKPLTLNERDPLSRNKANGPPTSTVRTKNMTVANGHCGKINPFIMSSKTKSVDNKSSKKMIEPPINFKYSLRKVSKGKKATSPNGNSKIVKHINELLKQSKRKSLPLKSKMK